MPQVKLSTPSTNYSFWVAPKDLASPEALQKCVSDKTGGKVSLDTTQVNGLLGYISDKKLEMSLSELSSYSKPLKLFKQAPTPGFKPIVIHPSNVQLKGETGPKPMLRMPPHAMRTVKSGDVIKVGERSFELTKLVGGGGKGGAHGKVFMAKELGEGASPNPVAIKIPRNDGSGGLRLEDRQEIVCLKEMNHPNIVKLVTSSNDFCILEGAESSLSGLLKDKHLSEKGVQRTFAGVAQAFAALHDSGYFHNDLNAGNFLWFERGGDPILKVSDFGGATKDRGVKSTVRNKDVRDLGELISWSLYGKEEVPTRREDFKTLPGGEKISDALAELLIGMVHGDLTMKQVAEHEYFRGSERLDSTDLFTPVKKETKSLLETRLSQ